MAISELAPDKVIVITDTNVKAAILNNAVPGADALLAVPPGEGSKCIGTATMLWEGLVDARATRASLVVNIGGGVVTDLGGFTAASFKRGLRFVNIPTTLLGMADAAIGGKTGIDFMGLKNEIGMFAPAERVIIDTSLLATLPADEIRSGFAEVVKMAMLTDAGLYGELLHGDALSDPALLRRATAHAAFEKQKIVALDPTEKGIRRWLNLGHTAAHAYESHAAAIGSPISHGLAVAHGLLRALKESARRCGCPASLIGQYEERVLHRYFAPLPFGPEAEPEVQRLMTHDKKNLSPGKINWVLLSDIGHPCLSC